MTTLTLEVPPNLYQWLTEEATRLGKSPQLIAQELLVERLTNMKPAVEDEREKVERLLKESGLLSELGPNLRQRAETAMATLEEVRNTLDESGGKPLSEIVLEQRRSKDW